MENATVAIFDDDAEIIKHLEVLLEAYGHSVSRVTRSMDEVPEAVDVLAAHPVDVAIVDGNLHFSRLNSEDGKEVIRKLRAAEAARLIIGFSGTHDVEGADHNIPKGARVLEILDLIRAL